MRALVNMSWTHVHQNVVQLGGMWYISLSTFIARRPGDVVRLADALDLGSSMPETLRQGPGFFVALK